MNYLHKNNEKDNYANVNIFTKYSKKDANGHDLWEKKCCNKNNSFVKVNVFTDYEKREQGTDNCCCCKETDCFVEVNVFVEHNKHEHHDDEE